MHVCTTKLPNSPLTDHENHVCNTPVPNPITQPGIDMPRTRHRPRDEFDPRFAQPASTTAAHGHTQKRRKPGIKAYMCVCVCVKGKRPQRDLAKAVPAVLLAQAALATRVGAASTIARRAAVVAVLQAEICVLEMVILIPAGHMHVCMCAPGTNKLTKWHFS